MHYYYFKIGDYVNATAHLTFTEDIAYRRMLDRLYDTELPLPCEIARIAKLIRMNENQAEIRDVLNEFWTETSDGWLNLKAQVYIDEYHAKADIARANGKKGGRPKTQKNPVGYSSLRLANPDVTQTKANQEPITNNQEPIKENNASLVLQSFGFFWKCWADCKKSVGVKNTSSKALTETKFTKMFSNGYFTKNNEQEFRDEINAMCKYAKDGHKIEGFNPFTNMQTGKFLTSQGWK